MPINRDKPDRWKEDVTASVDMYNQWFMQFAPEAFRTTRIQTTAEVEKALVTTAHLTNIQPETLRDFPAILPTLRMSTCPPLAVDRLIGLAGVPANLVKTMDSKGRLPPRMDDVVVTEGLRKISAIIERMADPDIFVWLNRKAPPTKSETHRAATIVADRLCGAVANPIVRNAQEKTPTRRDTSMA